MSRNTFLTVPDLDQSAFVGLLSIKVVPALAFVVTDADGLTTELEPVAIQLGRMDMCLG